MKSRTFLAISFCFITFTLTFGQTENPLEKAEALITELKFYEAFFALEPLLITEQKSEAQEEALWVANALCTQLIEILTDEYWEARKHPSPPGSAPPTEYSLKQEKVQEKVADLNRLGAGIISIGGNYWYHYAFLKRLVALYPNSSWHPAAEYYLIQEGYPAPQDVDKTLNALHVYVKKYAKSGLAEVYKAYLDIAHINHALWSLLIYPNADPEGDGDPGFITESEEDKELAEKHKAEALKYYAKFIVNGYDEWGLDQREGAIKDFEYLKQGKESGAAGWIMYDY